MKNGTATDPPVNDGGARGLGWRDEIAADVFECASVDAAQALADYKASVSGLQAGVKVGFPDFEGEVPGPAPVSGCAPHPHRGRPPRCASSTPPICACPSWER